jgi:hypothetical protein
MFRSGPEAPRFGPPEVSCTGERFTAVLAHAGDEADRAALCSKRQQLDVLQRWQLLERDKNSAAAGVLAALSRAATI